MKKPSIIRPHSVSPLEEVSIFRLGPASGGKRQIASGQAVEYFWNHQSCKAICLATLRMASSTAGRISGRLSLRFRRVPAVHLIATGQVRGSRASQKLGSQAELGNQMEEKKPPAGPGAACVLVKKVRS